MNFIIYNFSNFKIEFFLFIVSLENISIILLGKFFFTSSEILSTPGPLKINSQFPSFEQLLFKRFYIHSNDIINYSYSYDKLN